MYITKEKFEGICQNHSSLLVVESDVVDALMFVQELLEAEVDAIKAVEPEATASIDRLNAAAYEVFDIQSDIENEEFMREKKVTNNLVDFKAGYYEWNVFMSGVCMYTFEVDSGTFVDMNSDELEQHIDDCIQAMQEELREDGNFELGDAVVAALKRQMVEAWGSYFGITNKTVDELVGNAKERSAETETNEAKDLCCVKE